MLKRRIRTMLHRLATVTGVYGLTRDFSKARVVCSMCSKSVVFWFFIQRERMQFAAFAPTHRARMTQANRHILPILCTKAQAY